MKKSKKGSGRKKSAVAASIPAEPSAATPPTPGPADEASATEDPPEEVLAKRRRSKAYFIRTKLRSGESISEEQAAFLAEYEGTSGDADPGPGAAGAPPADSPPGAPGGPRVEPRGDLPPTPSPRLGPQTQARKGGGGRWQDGYSYGAGEATGREATCKMGAEIWLGTLKMFAAHLQEIGVDPIVEPESLRGAVILTLDAVLPPELELTPELVAAGGSTALLVQRVVYAKEIKAHQDRVKARSSSRPIVDTMASDGAPGPATPPEARPEPDPPPISTEPAVIVAEPPAPEPEAPAPPSVPPRPTANGSRPAPVQRNPWGPGERVL